MLVQHIQHIQYFVFKAELASLYGSETDFFVPTLLKVLAALKSQPEVIKSDFSFFFCVFVCARTQPCVCFTDGLVFSPILQ